MMPLDILYKSLLYVQWSRFFSEVVVIDLFFEMETSNEPWLASTCNPPASTSQVLVFQVYAIMPIGGFWFFNHVYLEAIGEARVKAVCASSKHLVLKHLVSGFSPGWWKLRNVCLQSWGKLSVFCESASLQGEAIIPNSHPSKLMILGWAESTHWHLPNTESDGHRIH
jgi:hypothetical protein